MQHCRATPFSPLLSHLLNLFSMSQLLISFYKRVNSWTFVNSHYTSFSSLDSGVSSTKTYIYRWNNIINGNLVIALNKSINSSQQSHLKLMLFGRRVYGIFSTSLWSSLKAMLYLKTLLSDNFSGIIYPLSFSEHLKYI